MDNPLDRLPTWDRHTPGGRLLWHWTRWVGPLIILACLTAAVIVAQP
jgi:hypothetical protein